jgi:hypothetical protein
MNTQAHSHLHEHATVATHGSNDLHAHIDHEPAHKKPVNPLSMINVVFALMFLLLAVLLAAG